LKWQWTGSSILPAYNQVMMAPVVIDLNKTGVPDVVFSTFAGGQYTYDGHLRAVRGDTGQELFTVSDPAYNVTGAGSLAVGDIDSSGYPTILAVAESQNQILAFNHDGTFRWRSPALPFNISWGGVAIADIDHDGTPEIIVGSAVLNNDGTIRWIGSLGRGMGGAGPLSIVANLDLTGNDEIIAGNTAYHADGSVYWSNPNVSDGFNAVARFDKTDPYPQVVVVSPFQSRLYLLNHDGTLRWSVGIPTGGGGPPTVADFDGSGQVGIGVAAAGAYTVFNADGTIKWSKPTQDFSSAETGSSVFDFYGDGRAEVIYGDETTLRIYDGRNGTVLWSTPSSSGTTYELPVIVDVDGTGKASIVKISNNYYINTSTGIQVYSDDRWVTTRKIWNQHTYHITNINDDGSIPQHETNNWDLYNNYRLNTLTGSGCLFGEPDLTASYVRKQTTSTSINVTARIGNIGNLQVGPGMSNAFYDGDPTAGGHLLGTVQTTQSIYPGQYEDVTLTVPLGTIAKPVWVVADDLGGLNFQHLEPNTTNNIYNSHVYLLNTVNQPPVVNAGPDQTITLPLNSVTLNGTATDDGLPIGVLTTQWSTVSGPGVVTFSAPASLQSTATFSGAGVYILRLTASDDELTSSSNVTITVISNITPSPTPTLTLTPSPTAPPPIGLNVPGCIDAALNQTTVSGQVPIKLAAGFTLQTGQVDYWPTNDFNLDKTLSTTAPANGGDIIAMLDTTLLANDSYTIRVTGTDNNGQALNCGVLVTVSGTYKPGRVRFTITDFTVPLTGLPITIGRTYDSLEKDRVGDFGNGWSLVIGHPRLEIDPAHNATLTLPDGKRVTFYFRPIPLFPVFAIARYLPEAGVFGSLKANWCPLLVNSTSGYLCFPDANSVPNTYTYTDPYGRQYVMSSDGTLQSITDLNGNVLTFTSNGITSSVGNLNVPFLRDGQGRITQIIAPDGNIYAYQYDTNGNLSEVDWPSTTTPEKTLYTYYDPTFPHLFKSATDPKGQSIIVDTYYPDGRLQNETAPGLPAPNNAFQYAYDVPNRITTVTNPDGGTVTSTYNAYGSVLSQVTQADATTSRTTTFTYDTNHNMLTHAQVGLSKTLTTSYTYDANGFQDTVTDPSGTITTHHNQFGELTDKTDQSGKTQHVAYDSHFLPQTVSDPVGQLGGFAWNSNGTIQTQFDGNGNPTKYGYDQYGNQTSVTDAQGHQTLYQYDNMGRLFQVNPPQGETDYTYDALGHILTMTRKLDTTTSHTTTYQYDANGNKTDEFDPRSTGPTSFHTQYIYNAANQLQQVKYPDGTSIQYEYDWRGHITKKTDQNRHIAQYTYNLAGDLVKTTEALGTPDESSTQYSYDDFGRKTQVIDGRGKPTSYVYDNAGRLLSLNAPLNHATSYTYYANGLRQTMTDGDSHTTTYFYDDRNRLTQTQYADNIATFTDVSFRSYDLSNNLTSVTDQNGEVTSYGYNELNQLTTVTRKLNATDTQLTQYQYDAMGNLSQIKDANGHITGFVYDALNHQTKKTWNDGSFELFGYDAVGNMTSHQLADSTTHVNLTTYDALNRITDINYFDGQHVHFDYTKTGQRYQVTLTDTTGRNDVTTYTYDNRDRVTKIASPNGNFVAYNYDNDNNRLSLTASNGTTNSVTSYTYDDANQLSSVAEGAAGTFAYSYDNVGLRKQMIYPNGITVDYSYDQLNRLKHLKQYTASSTLASYDYSLDKVGNRLKVTEADGSFVQWAYDDAYRLIGEAWYGAASGGTTTPAPSGTMTPTFVPPTTTITPMTATPLPATPTGTPIGGLIAQTSYSYDLVGNRLSMVKDGQTTNYSYYSNGLDQLQSDGTNTYTYDGRGNLQTVTKGTDVTTYAFDAADRLAGVTKTGSTSLTASYLYDGDGRRVKATNNGTITNYLWDEKSTYGDVVLETDASNAIVVDYVRSYTGALYAQDRNSTTSYYLYDGQGNVRALADTSANLTDRYAYDAFGTQHSTSGTTPNSYLYTGQQFDNLTGLYDLRARYYDTLSGRLLSRDQANYKLKQTQQIDRYNYAVDNPINFTDPTGNQVFVEYEETDTTSTEDINANEALAEEGQEDIAEVEQEVDEVEDTQCKFPNSFSANTLVATNMGEKPISQIKIGDQVLAYNQDTGKTAYYDVKATIDHLDTLELGLIIDDEQVEVTPNHLFYTKYRGWTKASDIKIGDSIRKSDGSYGFVYAIIIYHKNQRMYNLEVDSAHTFFVGQHQWLVHNTNPDINFSGQCDTRIHASKRLAKEAQVATKNQQVQNAIDAMKDRLRAGDFTDVKSLGHDDLYEVRHVASGARLYFRTVPAENGLEDIQIIGISDKTNQETVIQQIEQGIADGIFDGE
jgi:RHS repeat-associated protein